MDESQNSRKLKIGIIVLLVLLLLSIGAFAARVIYLNCIKSSTATAVVTDNLLGENAGALPTEAQAVEAVKNAATIALYQGRPSDNGKFQVANMLPGDSETRYFAVTVSHRADATVYFTADVTEQSRNLAEILRIKVTRSETDNVIYDGTFADILADGYGELFAATAPTDTVAYYRVDVSLPTSAGNEYQAAHLAADFRWYVKDAAVLNPPQTGESGRLIPLLIVMGCAVVLIIILLLTKRRERVANDAEEK